MRIEVDRDLCIGSGNCVNLARGVFVLDDEEELAEVADPTAASPEDIRRAAEACPTAAIILEEEDG